MIGIRLNKSFVIFRLDWTPGTILENIAINKIRSRIDLECTTDQNATEDKVIRQTRYQL
jgi:hypothetical protein